MGKVLLVFIVLQQALLSVLPVKSTEQRWHCTGELSEYTNRDCERLGGVDGCYFVLHFSYYRSCAFICNDIVVGSIEEERCNSECRGYLNGGGGCAPVTESDTNVSVASSTLSTSHTTSLSNSPPPRAGVKDGSNSNTVAVAVAVPIVVVVVMLLAVGIYLLVCRKRRSTPSPKSAGRVPPASSSRENVNSNGAGDAVEMHPRNISPVQPEATTESRQDHGVAIPATTDHETDTSGVGSLPDEQRSEDEERTELIQNDHREEGYASTDESSRRQSPRLSEQPQATVMVEQEQEVAGGRGGRRAVGGINLPSTRSEAKDEEDQLRVNLLEAGRDDASTPSSSTSRLPQLTDSPAAARK